jgi:hypothetical protein
MERVSSGGAVAKISPTPCGGLEGSANQVTNAVMPACATSPTQDRSSAGSARYQSRSSSSRRIAAAASTPLPSRTRRSVSPLLASGAVAIRPARVRVRAGDRPSASPGGAGGGLGWAAGVAAVRLGSAMGRA